MNTDLGWLKAVVFMATVATMSLAAQPSPATPIGDFVPESGMASWYGEPFHGRKTANGEIYDMLAMTAAHKTLPFGTLVLVTNLSDRSQVVVRINDRGPFIAGRIIDLSKAAGRLIGLDRSGTAKVEIRPAPTGAEVLPAPKASGTGLKTVFPDSRLSHASFRLQLGSYKDASNADAQITHLWSLGLKAVIERSGSYNRVVLYVAADERERAEAILRAAGYKNWLVKEL